MRSIMTVLGIAMGITALIRVAAIGKAGQAQGVPGHNLLLALED